MKMELLVLPGRKDSQVKINGFRIELNEINNVLAKFDNIKECTTIILENKNKKIICSYLASKNEKSIDESIIRNYLKQSLPYYMIPTYFVQMKSLPLTTNGKIDKKALPSPIQKNKYKMSIPKNAIEETLLDIFKSTLNIEDISTMDSFFSLGGDSLLAIKLIIQIKEKFKIKIRIQSLFDNPTICQLAELISNSKNHSNNSDLLTKVEVKDFYNLSSAQKRIYYSSKIAGEDTILYNTPGAIVFNKKPDIKKLNECFKKLIKRHSSLRTYFEEINEGVYQKIAPSLSFELEEIEIRNKNLNEIMEEFVKPFNLEKAPLFHTCFINSEDKSLLLFDMHHIICDGASLSIFTKELSDLYNGKNVSDLSFNYIDYAEWEFKNLQNGKFNENKDYWINQFKDNIPILDLPTDYVRPSVQSFEGAKIYKNIDKVLADKILGLSKELNVSPYMLLLASYYVLLHKYSNSEDIIVGSPVENRNIPEISNMLGMFVNTLPLKCHIENGISFKDFLNTVKSNCIAAFDNAIYPFDKLVNDLKITRDTSRSPLFDTMFIYQNAGISSISFDGIKSEIFTPDTNISKFDFSLEVIPQDNGEFDLNFEYCTKLFKKETIERLSTHFINIVEQIIDNSETNIEDIDILSKEERHKILYEFNNTEREYPRNKTVIELFEEQVKKTPDNIALVFEDKKMTYSELHHKVNALAFYLQKQNVKHGDIICMLFDKSFEMIISILSVLKLGACYLPIDITYPKDRIDYIINDSKSKIVLSTKDISCNLPSSISTLHVDLDNSEIYNSNGSSVNVPYFNSEDIAYIMYTSGSTGRPKGVMVKNINVVRLIENTNFIKFSEHERILQTGSIVFDACTFEIWAALLHGFELYIIKKSELLDVTIFEKYLLKNKITILWLTAPLFNQLCESNPNMFSNAKYLLTGGDILSPKHINMVRKGNPNLTIINGYGPTENTTFSTCFTIDKTYEKTIPIGSPIANSTAYVVSSSGSLLPIGLSGELWVGGDGVSAGYFNNPDLTNEKFIKNPFGSGMVYKTGDLVKWLPDGNIDFIGRIDNQVKIRGFRVELNEINNIFSNFNNIKECTTIICDVQNKKTICSYFTSKNGSEININTIKSYLKKYLPSYMIPTYIYQLDKMPLTVNGKIDKKKLSVSIIEDNRKTNHIQTNTQEKLLDIWVDLFDLDKISIDDNFFNLGGDSLLCIKLISRIYNQFNTKITMKQLFNNPSIKTLSAIIDSSSEKSNKATITIQEEKSFYPTSSAQKRIYLSSKMDENSTLYNIYGGILLDSMPNINKLQNALNTVVRRHESLRTYFEIINKQLVQKIVNNLDVKITIQDVNTNNPNEIFYIYVSNFNLNKVPLFNITLFALPNGKVLLMLDIHHIIFDGTSLNNFIQELLDSYNGKALPELSISYKDFAVWENNMLETNGFEESKEFWNNQFTGDIPILNLPETFPRPKIKNYNGMTYITYISKYLTQKINIFATKHNVTPFMVMLACYYILLNKYTDNEDIIVGTPTSGRIYKELEPLLGMFVNSIPLRNSIYPNIKFEDFLQNIKNSCVDAFAHQDYPFDILVNDLKLKKDSSRNLLFDTMFIYQNAGINSPKLDSLHSEYITPLSTTSKFDISLEVLPEDGKLTLFFEYCTKLFDEIFIGNFAKSYENILNIILDKPEILIKNIPIIENTENNLSDFNKIELENKEDLELLENKIASNVFSSFTNEKSYDTISVSSNNAIEKQVADVFKRLLPVSDIGPDDNFFDLGGDSLSAVNLQIELLKSNFKITYADIFEYPTIKELAQKISSNTN